MIDRTVQPSILSPDAFTVLQPERTRMPNGIPLNVLRMGDKEVVRVDFLFKAGSWYQDQPLQALFTNRMLREGTRRFTTAELSVKLDFFGAWLDLSTSPEYAFVTLYSLTKYLPQTLDVVESLLKEPMFPERELAIVTENNLRQFQVNLSKVDYLAHRELLHALYGDRHPGGRIVTEPDYRAIRPDVLQAFYRRYYHSGNCSIYLSGKVEEETVRLVESHFGSEPFGVSSPQPDPVRLTPVPASERRIFVERPDSLQSAVRLGMPCMDSLDPDFPKFRVLVTLLGGYFGSRLMSNIREEKGYTYGISAGIIPYPSEGVFVIGTEAANEYVEPLIREVYHEIDRLCTEPVPDEELAMVKNYMLGDLCRSYESAFSLADAWISAQVNGLPDTCFADSQQAVITVSSEEIRELANRCFCKETLKEVISGKKMS